MPIGDWRQTIDDAIKSCKVAVVVIGPAFLNADAQGKPRILEEDDVVRHELTQLLTTGKKILPVLIDDAELPKRDALPPELHSLRRYQTPKLNNKDWADVTNSMIRAIETSIGPGPG